MCQLCRNEEDAVNDEARVAVLARWKARVEAAGKGFPTDEDLLDLMRSAAGLDDGCTCSGHKMNLQADGFPIISLCACQWKGLRAYFKV